MTQPDPTQDHRQRLLAQRAAVLTPMAAQRAERKRAGLAGLAGLADVANVADAHVYRPEDVPAPVAGEGGVEFELNERETAALGDIAAALERLDLGTYGQCTDCGGAISSLRLQALPEAARCIACQERAEQLPPFVRA